MRDLPQRDYSGYYQRFEEYLHEMRELALSILDELKSEERIIRNFFMQRYSSAKEQYWSIKKLYSFAMFLPVFLQIGLSHFDRLVYIDTHAGPGLAKVGPEEGEVVLGSPLIALKWPEIVAEKCKHFRKISRGFTKYIFIEKTQSICDILKKIVSRIAGDRAVEVIPGDSNIVLPSLAKKLSEENKKTLVLLFVDPFGELESQLGYEALSSLLGGKCKVDVVMNIMSAMLARGFSSMLTSSYYRSYKRWVRYLFDDLHKYALQLSLFKYYSAGEPPSGDTRISRDDVVEAYAFLLKHLGYQAVYSVPVEYKGGNILYHLIFASKSPGAHKWLGNYIAYIKAQLPRGYDNLKSRWFKVSQKGLFKWFT